jgi:CBS domain-containing protein/PII-like signaling protein
MTGYATIKVYTNERAKYEGKDLAPAIVAYIRSLKIAARCVVTRGIEGCYENGEIATSRLTDLSYDLPLVIEILLPSTEADAVIHALESMVADGIVSLAQAEVTSFRTPASLLPPRLLVRDIMTARPIDGRPDFPLRVAVDFLLDNRLKALPIVDGNGLAVGIVTQGDLMKRASMPSRLGLLHLLPKGKTDRWLGGLDGRMVSEIMTKNPQTIQEDRKAAEAIHLMVRARLKRLPVVDASGKLKGIVSRIDVLKALARTRREPEEPSDAAGLAESPRFVRDVVPRDRLAMPASTTLRAAIDLLSRDEAQRAAVVDGDGRLLGLVTDSILVEAIDRASSGLRILRRLGARKADTITVGDIMMREVVSVGEDSPIDEAIRLMIERGFKRIPVVDSEGRFTGMVRRDSVLIALARHV